MHTMRLISISTLLVAVSIAMPADPPLFEREAVYRNEDTDINNHGSGSERQPRESFSIALQPILTAPPSYEQFMTDDLEQDHDEDPENGLTEVRHDHRNKVKKIVGGTTVLLIIFGVLLYLSMTINKEGKVNKHIFFTFTYKPSDHIKACS